MFPIETLHLCCSSTEMALAAGIVAMSGGYSVVVMCRLLIVVASLLVGHGLQGTQAQ